MKKYSFSGTSLVAKTIIFLFAGLVFLAAPKPAEASCIYNETNRDIQVQFLEHQNSRGEFHHLGKKMETHQCWTGEGGYYHVSIETGRMLHMPNGLRS